MGLFAKIFSPPARQKKLTSADLAALMIGYSTAAGVDITPKTALRVPVFAGCVKVISESVAQLPLKIYTRSKNGDKQVAAGHPLYRLLHDQPNPWTTSQELRVQMVRSLILYGNAYVFINRVGSRVRELISISPKNIRVKQRPDYTIDYSLRTESGWQSYPAGSIWHMRLDPDAGEIIGTSCVETLRETLGYLVTARDHMAILMKNYNRPDGMFIHPGVLQEAPWQRLKQQLDEQSSGANKGKAILLEDGLGYSPISVTNKDSQYIETYKLHLEEVCRAMRIQPHMAGILDRATFSNIESQDIGFVKHTLMPWVKNFETTINRDLLTPSEQDSYFAEFDVAGFERGDIKTRYEAYASGIQNGHLSPNEVRGMENRNARAGGDDFLRPLNMSPSSEADAVDDGNKMAVCGCGKKHHQGELIFKARPEKMSSDDEIVQGIVRQQRLHGDAVQSAVGDVVRHEITAIDAAIKKLIDPAATELELTALKEFIDLFYKELPETIKRKLRYALWAYQDGVAGEAARMVQVSDRVGNEIRRELNQFKRDYLDAFASRYAGQSLAGIKPILQGHRVLNVVTPDKFIQVMNRQLSAWSVTRATSVANEELIRSAWSVSKESWRLAGVTKLRWHASGPDQCPFCQKLNGKIVGIEEHFIEDALYAQDATGNWMGLPAGHKGHPPIHRGCVCSIIPEGVPIKKNYFAIAEAGGKHAGYLENYIKQQCTPAMIRRGVESNRRVAAEHLAFIENPLLKIPNFYDLDRTIQRRLLSRTWPAHADEARQRADVLEGLLEDKG